MIDLLYNPWVITIIGGVVVVLILRYIFGIGKTKEGVRDTRKAGVIDEGISATYTNCEGVGEDAGLISKGKNLTSTDSNWSSRDEVIEKQKLMFEKNKRNQYKNSSK